MDLAPTKIILKKIFLKVYLPCRGIKSRPDIQDYLQPHYRGSGNFFYRKSTIGTTIVAIEMNNDTYCSGGSRISCRGAWTSWGGRGLPRRLRFIKFVCQNKRIGTRRAPPKFANVLSQKRIKKFPLFVLCVFC